MEKNSLSKNLWSEEYQRKKIHPLDIEQKIAEIRKENKTIATINGSFDLLHAGHLQILYEGSKSADIFLVALNSDESIRQYKDPKRPIIPLEYRMQMMAMLECVDFVTWFDETTPLSFLEKVRPDVHVNGSEYGENCIEAETIKKIGGKLYLVNLIPGLSTSQILRSIHEKELR